MPLSELNRLEAVQRFINLETTKEKEIQHIVNMIAIICKTKTALITLVDEKSQHVIFRHGSDLVQTSRSEAFCSHTIEQEDLLIIHDAQVDSRFQNNALVTGDPYIRFYAGAKLTTHDGYHVGSLCVIDDAPKTLTWEQRQILELLAKQVIHILEFDSSIQYLKEQFVSTKLSEVKLRSYFESSGSCHLLMGKTFNTLVFNKALANFIFEISGRQIQIEDNILDIVSPSFKDEFKKCNTLALEGQGSLIEKTIQYANKSVYWYMTFEPARNSLNEIIGVSFNATDITSRMLEKQRVIDQNKALAKIAFVQSHELRRPVASILGFMEILKADDYSADRSVMLMMERAVNELDQKIREIVYAAECENKTDKNLE